MAVWQGVNQGLRAGLAIAGQINDQERQSKLDGERAEDRTYQRGLQAAQSARLEKQDKRQGALDGLTVAKGLNEQAAGLASAGYMNGSLSPESETRLQSLTSQADSITKQSHADLGYAERAAEARNTLDEIDKGADIASMPASKVADAFRYTFGHPTASFLDGDGPSEIGKAYADFSAGMESGDMASMVNGANTLLAPEIKYGVGTQNDKGDTIIDKRATAVYPSARDQKKGVIDMTITARRKDGTTYEYPAWMTKGRGSAKPEGGDEHEFDIEPVLQRINAYGDLLGVIHDPVKGPQIQKKFIESQQAGDDDVFKANRAKYAQMAVARGADPKNFKDEKTTKQKEYEFIVGENVKAGLSAAAARKDALNRVARDPVEIASMNNRAAEDRARIRDTEKAPKISDSFINRNIEDAKERVASKYGLRFNKDRGYETADGSAADEATVEKLRNEASAAADAIESAAAEGRKLTAAEALKTGAAQARPALVAPKSGEVKNGYRFKGGNPADRTSWEKVS